MALTLAVGDEVALVNFINQMVFAVVDNIAPTTTVTMTGDCGVGGLSKSDWTGAISKVRKVVAPAAPRFTPGMQVFAAVRGSMSYVILQTFGLIANDGDTPTNFCVMSPVSFSEYGGVRLPNNASILAESILTAA
jgi:hypothetical protein